MVPPIPPAGLLALNKPAGVTSRDAVNVVQRAARGAGWGKRVKVGHAGTLDPLATGVLVVCVGKATKLIARVQALPKTYRAGFRLHASSPTLDIEGDVTPVPDPPAVTADDLRAVLPRFVGTIDQTPPAFSAVKVAGRRAYALARKGEEVKLAAKPVVVHRLDLLGCDGGRFGLLIECGSGFYVRSLGRDVAAALGTAAVMDELTRTRIGGFQIADAVDPTGVTAETLPGLLSLPFGRFGLPVVSVTEQQAADLRGGRTAAAPGGAGECGAVDPAGLPACVGERDMSGTLHPRITFPVPTV